MLLGTRIIYEYTHFFFLWTAAREAKALYLHLNTGEVTALLRTLGSGKKVAPATSCVCLGGSPY